MNNKKKTGSKVPDQKSQSLMQKCLLGDEDPGPVLASCTTSSSWICHQMRCKRLPSEHVFKEEIQCCSEAPC